MAPYVNLMLCFSFDEPIFVSIELWFLFFVSTTERTRKSFVTCLTYKVDINLIWYTLMCLYMYMYEHMYVCAYMYIYTNT